MDFFISKSELSRRQKAYAALVGGVFAGFLVFPRLFGFSLPLLVYLAGGLAFFLLGLTSFASFKTLSAVRIRLTGRELERSGKSRPERFDLSGTRAFTITRRTNGMIREICLLFPGRRTLCLTAMEPDFERLQQELTAALPSGVAVKDHREPLDYDHPLFYPVLGLLLALAGSFFIRTLLTADRLMLKYWHWGLAGAAFLLALYILWGKPVASRTGDDPPAADYLIGAAMLLAGLLVLFLS